MAISEKDLENIFYCTKTVFMAFFIGLLIQQAAV